MKKKIIAAIISVAVLSAVATVSALAFSVGKSTDARTDTDHSYSSTCPISENKSKDCFADIDCDGACDNKSTSCRSDNSNCNRYGNANENCGNGECETASSQQDCTENKNEGCSQTGNTNSLCEDNCDGNHKGNQHGKNHE